MNKPVHPWSMLRWLAGPWASRRTRGPRASRVLRRVRLDRQVCYLCGTEGLEQRSMLAATSSSTVFSVTPLGTGLTPQDLAQALVGPGVTVSNVSFAGTNSGTNASAGLFSGGLNAGIGLSGGVVLSSGAAAGAIGPNSSDSFSTTLNTPGDSSLDVLVPGSKTYDATVLEFDVTISASVLTVQYVFASDEYDEFAGSKFNDVFGFFVNGKNIATLSGTSVAVSINTVNHLTRSEYFRQNDRTQFGSSTPYAVQPDGFTTVLQATASLPVGTHRLKLAIADASDRIYDSWVFIGSEGIASGRTDVAVAAAASADSVAVGDEVVYTYTVTNRGADTATAIVLEDLIPAGLTVTSLETTRGSIANVAGAVTAAIGSLGNGEQAVISVKATANASGLFAHGARLRIAQQDTDPTNDVARVTTAVSASASPIKENSGGQQVVYTPVIQDPMKILGGVVFSIAGTDASAFTIDPVSGAVTLIADPDYEVKPIYRFTVVATNTAGKAFNIAVTLPITDVDEPAVTIAAADADKPEGTGASPTPFTFTVTRQSGFPGSSSVAWAVAGSGPKPANAADFSGGVLPSGTVSFAAGETTKMITVNVAADSPREADEGFTVTLSSPVNAKLTSATASGIIRNDDPRSRISIAAADAVKSEGDVGRTPFSFTLTRTGDLSDQVSVPWSIVGSNAYRADRFDFIGGVLPSGTIRLAAGRQTQTLVVNVLCDRIAEFDEEFTVTLGTPLGGLDIVEPGLNSAAATIRNDDPGAPRPAAAMPVQGQAVQGRIIAGLAGDGALAMAQSIAAQAFATLADTSGSSGTTAAKRIGAAATKP